MELYQITRLVSPRISRRLVMALPPNRQDTKATAAVRDLVTDEILRMVKSGEWRTVPR